MRFATTLLLASVSTTELTIPTIEWDQTKIDVAASDFKNGTDTYNDSSASNDLTFSQDLSHAYAKYRVAEYANFGKNLKPLAELDVELIDAISVKSTCDRDAMIECVNSYMLGASDTTTHTCVTTAGCNMNWDDMTAVEQQALADKYDTRTEVVEQAYETMVDDFEDDLEVAAAAHKTRQDEIDAEFALALKTVAVDMGCDETKLTACALADFSHNCLDNCDCGTDVIRVTPTQVNTFSVLKSTYGDVNSMSRKDIQTTNEMILNF